MSAPSVQVLRRSPAAKDVVAHQQAVLRSLSHQLADLKRAIAKAAHAQGLECGDCSQRVSAALSHLHEANQAVQQSGSVAGQTAEAKEKATAIQKIADAKVALRTAEICLQGVFEALGAWILVNHVPVPGAEQQIARAEEIQRQLQDTGVQAGRPIRPKKRKIGIAVVACLILLAVCGALWYAAGGPRGGTSVEQSEPEGPS